MRNITPTTMRSVAIQNKGAVGRVLAAFVFMNWLLTSVTVDDRHHWIISMRTKFQLMTQTIQSGSRPCYCQIAGSYSMMTATCAALIRLVKFRTPGRRGGTWGCRRWSGSWTRALEPGFEGIIFTRGELFLLDEICAMLGERLPSDCRRRC